MKRNVYNYYFYLNAGLLEPPADINIASATYSTIHFQWIPPFTLLNDSRIVYEVSITSAPSNSITTDTATEPAYIHRRQDYRHCGKVILQVAAMNEVGKSNQSKRIEAGFYGRK